MPRFGPTWPGALPSLKKIFQIRVPSHPSFGRFKRFLRRREPGPGTPPRHSIHEGDDRLNHRSSSPSSTHSTRTLGQEPSILDSSAVDASMLLAADEYNSNQYASTSSARGPPPSPPLSAISSESFPVEGLGDLPSSSTCPAAPRTKCPSLPRMSPIPQMKPNKLVIDQEMSLADIQHVLSALQHRLQDLTIGPAGIKQHAWPSTTEKIDLSHLTSLKVDRVDYRVLRELLSSVKMDNLIALDLHADSPEATLSGLNIKWTQLTDVTLHGDFSPKALYKVMMSLHNVIQLKWSGKLVGANQNNYPCDLDSLQDLSVCSNEDGCTFFLRNLRSTALQTLHLSDFTPLLLRSEQHGLSSVKTLYIEHGVDADQLRTILQRFATLTTADFEIGGITAAEQYGRFLTTGFAPLTSLTLRNVSAPIWPLLMSMSLSGLTTLDMTFDLKSAAEHQFCFGLADFLRKQNIQLETLHLVDANMTQDELRSCLETVGPTLVDYQIRQSRLQGDALRL